MKPRVFRAAGRLRGAMLAILAAVVVFVAFAALPFVLFTGPFPLEATLGVLLAAGVSVLLAWHTFRFMATARLTVDDEGIEVKADLPRWMAIGPNRPGRVRWDEIAKVVVLRQPPVVQIRRRGSSLPMVLRVVDWVPVEAPPGALAAPSHFLRGPDMRATALWKVLEERGLFAIDRPDGHVDAINFDLAKHPATRAAMALMAVLAAYWAIDSFVENEAWAEWRLAYLVPHIVVGAVALAAAATVLRMSRTPSAVPGAVTVVVAVLIGTCAGLASWAGLIRVNQAFGGPLEPHAYVRNDTCDALVPLERGLPPIEYTAEARDYWCRFPKTWRHTVLVRKGLGDLYQVDLTEHTRAIRRFRNAPWL
ncbi:MAG TPA: hypothetical protein VFP36_00635, partial [Usitatibacter sp.]|nr:hypothetical protein [Usitatibacter sp.]